MTTTLNTVSDKEVFYQKLGYVIEYGFDGTIFASKNGIRFRALNFTELSSVIANYIILNRCK